MIGLLFWYTRWNSLTRASVISRRGELTREVVRSYHADGYLHPALRHPDGLDRQLYREHAVARLAGLLPPAHQGHIGWIRSTWRRRTPRPVWTPLQRHRYLLLVARPRLRLPGPGTTTVPETVTCNIVQ